MVLKNVFMLYLFHLKATTDIQTITTTAADQGSTFGMYIHFTFYKGSSNYKSSRLSIRHACRKFGV